MAETTNVASVSPPPVYYRYSLKAEKGTDGYRLSAHVYSNDRDDAVEQLALTLLAAEARLKADNLPVSTKVKE